MRYLRNVGVAAVALATFSLPVLASEQTEFCNGYEVGYQTIKGNNAAVPACPAVPATPADSTPYQEGLKAGMRDAQKN